MPNKSVPFSVRLSTEDAEFVASLQMPGAVTPSDKIRKIISEARERSEQAADFHELTRRFEKEFRLTNERVKNMERESEQESELLDFAGNWLSQICAEYMAGPVSASDLPKFEARIARLVAKLTEQMTRVALANDAACYDPLVVSSNMKRTIELVKLISNQNPDEPHSEKS